MNRCELSFTATYHYSLPIDLNQIEVDQDFIQAWCRYVWQKRLVFTTETRAKERKMEIMREVRMEAMNTRRLVRLDGDEQKD
jgi:hypothetical protein